MPFFESEDRRIHYQLTGSGDPLVLIHGIALDSRIWLDLPEFLSKKFTVLTYDLRGHGESFVPDTGYSYRDHVTDLKLLLESLKFPTVSIVAHSLGGAIAVKYALQSLTSVKAMALAAPHIVGFQDYTAWPNVFRTARMIDIDQARIQWEMFRLFSRLEEGSEAKRVFNQCLKDFPGKLWIDPQVGRYVEESDLKLLDSLSMPLLVLCGREDHDFLPLAKIINAQATNGSLYEIPNCGHMIFLEKPEIAKRELAAFLKL